jgi:hypothetical protein
MMMAKQQDSSDSGGEYQKPDAKLAFQIFDKHIKPKLSKIATAKGDLSEPWKELKEKSNFPKSVVMFIDKLEEMEPEKQEHFLLALHEGFQLRGLVVPTDLVSMAEGNEGGSIVPVGEPDFPELHTVN